MSQKSAKNPFSFLALLFGVVVLLTLASLNLYNFLKEEEVLGITSESQEFNSEILFWENFLLANNNYLDGWFELAKLKINEGDIEGAKGALNKIEEINPNSPELLRLRSSF